MYTTFLSSPHILDVLFISGHVYEQCDDMVNLLYNSLKDLGECKSPSYALAKDSTRDDISSLTLYQLVFDPSRISAKECNSNISFSFSEIKTENEFPELAYGNS